MRALPPAAARLVDALLEVGVVPSFSRVGPAVRSRTAGWAAPPALPGRRVLVTGATAGIGLETARRLAALGADLTILGRDEARTRAAVAAIDAAGGGAVDHVLADMAEPDDVRRAADEVAARHDRLDVLVHNAGAMATGYRRSSAGVEQTIAAQVLGPFALTTRLLPLLRAAAPARVVTVASGGMYVERLDVEGLDPGPTADFDGPRAYARAKRAQVALTAEWARRVPAAEVVFHAMHPGWVDTGGLRSWMPRATALGGPLLRDVGQGADTIVWLAAAPEALRTSGGFWLDRRRRGVHRLPWTRRADEAAEERRLFAWCEAHTGLAPAV